MTVIFSKMYSTDSLILSSGKNSRIEENLYEENL